jgi:hypothetical protein
MPTPRPLNPFEARATLANRLTRIADRIRQFSTSFGLRPYRVFLVWSRFDGEERGEGNEREVQRTEILPTPRISSLTSLQNMAYGAGVLSTGTLQVDLISPSIPQSALDGTRVPSVGQDLGDYPNDLDFWWEIRFDQRTVEDIPVPLRFRLSATPVLLPGQVGWSVVLEKQEEATNAADRLPPFADR